MKTIVAGPRDFMSYGPVVKAIFKSRFKITELFSGTAKGVDNCGEVWARSMGVPIRLFPPNWKQYGDAAGPMRNRLMATQAEALIALKYRDNPSRGTASMINIARELGLKIYIYSIDREV